MVAVQKDLVFGAHLSFQETFCGPHNKEIVKGIAEFPFHDLVVEQVQIARKIIPLAVMFDVGNIRYNLLHKKLRICLSRFGWPWSREVCMLMLKCHNVYTDTSIVYFDDAPQMYHQMFMVDMGPKWLDRSLRHQVMFGSGDPGLEQIRMINAVRGLELRDSTKELILSRNALEFLGLEKDLRWTND